jgi:hypothetical protein
MKIPENCCAGHADSTAYHENEKTNRKRWYTYKYTHTRTTPACMNMIIQEHLTLREVTEKWHPLQEPFAKMTQWLSVLKTVLKHVAEN